MTYICVPSFYTNNAATIPNPMGTRSERMRTPLQSAPRNLAAEPGATCPPGQSEATESPWQRRRGALLRWPEPSGPQWHLEAPWFMRFPILASRIPRRGAPGQAGVLVSGWAVLGRLGSRGRLDQAPSLDLAALRQASLAEKGGEGLASPSDQDAGMEGEDRRG